jgi:hypothetical protein
VSTIKKAVFIEEDTEDQEVLEGLKELEELPKKALTSEELDGLFNYEPLRVSEVANQESVVEVTPLRNFKCSYGGTWYYFVKEKKQRVPESMRDWLLKNKENPRVKDVW